MVRFGLSALWVSAFSESGGDHNGSVRTLMIIAFVFEMRILNNRDFVGIISDQAATGSPAAVVAL